MDDTTMRQLGERVHMLRRRLRLSQKELADAIGASPTTVSNLEQGKLSTLHLSHLIGLARVLHMSTDRLLGLAGNDDEVDVQSELLTAAVA